jgi:hypothetical protein
MPDKPTLVLKRLVVIYQLIWHGKGCHRMEDEPYGKLITKTKPFNRWLKTFTFHHDQAFFVV